MQIIKAKAPARVDLAGGTLDLWPLHLFFENTATLNCTIDQYAEVTIEVGAENALRRTSSILLESADRGVKHEFNSYAELLESFQGTHKAIGLSPALWLHARVARHFYSLWKKPASFKLSTQCASPAGAGLGGSSALNIALCSAFRKLTNANISDEDLISLARDLETTVIEVPAGVQDYWSALFGGVQAIRLDAGRTHRKVFLKSTEFIQSHLILCYSGQSRNSGINNWAVYKSFIDKDKEIHSAFQNIVKAAYRVEEALEKRSTELLIEGINLEWNSRQKLAPTIATKDMLETIEFAKSKGALGAKVCGAGGGGCYIVVVPPQKKKDIQDQLRARDVHVIDFKVIEGGCEVTA